MASGCQKSLMARAVDFLARREHSRLELSRKLSRYLQEHETHDDIESVLDRLQSKGLLSDERYARSRARVRSLRYGNARVEFELKQQGIDEGLIRETLDSLEENELDRAQRLWEKRFGNVAADFKERNKQIRFLAARGFGFDVISQIVR